MAKYIKHTWDDLVLRTGKGPQLYIIRKYIYIYMIRFSTILTILVLHLQPRYLGTGPLSLTVIASVNSLAHNSHVVFTF